jgi:hypothetical protein
MSKVFFSLPVKVQWWLIMLITMAFTAAGILFSFLYRFFSRKVIPFFLNWE